MRVYPDRKDSVGVSLRSQGQDSDAFFCRLAQSPSLSIWVNELNAIRRLSAKGPHETRREMPIPVEQTEQPGALG